jgi:hypothetical protein
MVEVTSHPPMCTLGIRQFVVHSAVQACDDHVLSGEEGVQQHGCLIFTGTSRWEQPLAHQQDCRCEIPAPQPPERSKHIACSSMQTTHQTPRRALLQP